MIVDMVLDVVCPWCYLGKRQLDKALSMREGVVSQVRFRPYQLSPDTPAEGVDRAAYYARKFRGQEDGLAQSRQFMCEAGEALGIHFDFERKATIANTMDAHRLIRWAGGFESVPNGKAGAQSNVVEALMKAYFEDGQNLGDARFLADVAASAGMDEGLVAELLASDRDKDTVAADVAYIRQMGIRGVPFYIFDGKAAISGAEGVESIVAMIDKVASHAGAAVS